MTTPLIVVIATHDRCQLLERTLRSLAECERPRSYAETIVVENGGKYGADVVVRGAAPELNVRYLYHVEGNKSAALNHVLDSVDVGLLIFTDDDVRFDPEFLSAYAAAVEEHGKGHFFGGPVSVDYESEPPEWLKQHLPHSVVGWEHKAEGPIDEPIFLGANWAAYATDLTQAGRFPTHVGPGADSQSVGQDTLMQRDLLQNGIVGGYVASARIWHFVPQNRSSFKWTLQRSYRHAIQGGLDFEDACPRLFGYPRWMIREAFWRWLRAIYSSVFGNQQAAFHAWLEYSKLTGLMRGVKMSGSAEQTRQ